MKITEKRTNRGYLFRACMSSHHLLRLAKTWRQAEGWESFIAKERVKASCVLWLKAVGKMEVSSLEAGHIMRLVWRAYLTFFVQSWFESNGKNRKVGSHWPSPDTSGPEVFCRDVVWLPGLPDQSSVVIYSLVIVCILSLRPYSEKHTGALVFFHPGLLPPLSWLYRCCRCCC